MKRSECIKILVIFLCIFFCAAFINNAQAEIPQEAEIHNQMGNDYCSKGKFEKAVLEYQKAVEIYPQFVDALYNLGVTYYNDIKDYEKAVKYFNQFLKYEGDTQDAKQVASIIDTIEKEHGIKYLPEEKQKEAPQLAEKPKIKEVKEIQDVKPQQTKAIDQKQLYQKALEYKNKGNQYTRDGEYKLAINQYQKALEIYPRYTDVLYNIAKIYYFELNDKASTIKYCEDFIKYEPKDSKDIEVVQKWLNDSRASLGKDITKEEGKYPDVTKKEDIVEEKPLEKKVEIAETKQVTEKIDDKDKKRINRDMRENDAKLIQEGGKFESRPYTKGPIAQIALLEQTDNREPIAKSREIQKESIEDNRAEKVIKTAGGKEILLTAYLPKDMRTTDIYTDVKDEIEKELILIFTQKKANDPRGLADMFKAKMQRDILPNGDEVSILKLPSEVLANIKNVHILNAEDRKELEKEKWDLIRSRRSPNRLKELLNIIREGYIIK